MISKEEFFNFITHYQTFDKAFDRIENALFGRKYGSNLYEADWVESVGGMLDVFINSHFTEEGASWINYYLFEDIEDKLVKIKIEADLFEGKKELEYHLNSLEELWNFLLTNTKQYFKNV